MTTTQTAIYAFIRDFRSVHPYGPTYQDIATELRISPQAVHYQVLRMQVAGLLRHEVSVARSLDVIQGQNDLARTG